MPLESAPSDKEPTPKVQAKAPSDSDPLPLIRAVELKALKHEVRNILAPLRNAASCMILDEHELAPILDEGISLLESKIEDFTSQTVYEYSGTKLCTLITSIVPQLQRVNAALRNISVEIEDCHSELEKEHVRANPAGWTGLLTNLLYNSVRKGANQMRIRFEKSELSGVVALKISVSDNGEGIPPEKLEKVRNPGLNFTDKKEGDGLEAGESLQDHGQGLAMVRCYIEERCNGVMHIDSSQEEGKSGTTISFLLPSMRMQEIPHVEGQVSEARQVLPLETNKHSRMAHRRVFIAAAGAAAAAALFTLFEKTKSAKEEIDRSPKQSPLADLQLDSNGKIQSFSIVVGDRKIRIDRNGMANSADFRDTAFIDYGSISMAGSDIRLGNKFEKMFMVSSSHGLFGHIREGNGRSLFIHSLRPDSATSEDSLCPQTDTVIGMREDNQNGKVQRVATSAKLLRSPTFGLVLQDLQLIEKGMQDRVLLPSESSLLARIRRLVHDLQSLHAKWGNDAIDLSSLRELHDVLEHRDGKMFILPHDVAKQLHEQPLTREQVLLLGEHHNMVCLLDTLSSEAERYMALPAEDSLAVRR